MTRDFDYEQRHRVALDRLTRLLDPHTPKEARLVEWLGTWDLETVEVMAAMVERRTVSVSTRLRR